MSATTREWSAHFDPHLGGTVISFLLGTSIKHRGNFHTFRA
jgi:hypothetical protein